MKKLIIAVTAIAFIGIGGSPAFAQTAPEPTVVPGVTIPEDLAVECAESDGRVDSDNDGVSDACVEFYTAAEVGWSDHHGSGGQHHDDDGRAVGRAAAVDRFGRVADPRDGCAAARWRRHHRGRHSPSLDRNSELNRRSPAGTQYNIAGACRRRDSNSH